MIFIVYIILAIIIAVLITAIVQQIRDRRNSSGDSQPTENKGSGEETEINIRSGSFPQEKEKKQIMENEETRNKITERTIDIMLSSLREIGCIPETDEEEGRVNFKYQGENFTVQFGGPYVHIWDPFWASLGKDDLAMPRLINAVNTANYLFAPRVVFTDPDEENRIWLHSRSDLMLHPACPDNTDFIRASLEAFFFIKEQVRRDFNDNNSEISFNNPMQSKPSGLLDPQSLN